MTNIYFFSRKKLNMSF